jgi:hypothetical protein
MTRRNHCCKLSWCKSKYYLLLLGREKEQICDWTRTLDRWRGDPCALPSAHAGLTRSSVWQTRPYIRAKQVSKCNRDTTSFTVCGSAGWRWHGVQEQVRRRHDKWGSWYRPDAPGDPMRPVALSSMVSQQQGEQYLADLVAWHHDACLRVCDNNVSSRGAHIRQVLIHHVLIIIL